MADIKSVKSQRTFYRVDDGIAQLLLDAFPESFVRAGRGAQEPVPKIEPIFVACKNPFTGKPQIQLTVGARVEFYNGTPKDAVKTFAEVGYKLPAEVVAAYAALLGEPDPSSKWFIGM